MQNCVKCGTPLTPDVVFCPQCGTHRQTGGNVPEDNLGTLLSIQPTPTATEVAPPPPTPVPPVASQPTPVLDRNSGIPASNPGTGQNTGTPSGPAYPTTGPNSGAGYAYPGTGPNNGGGASYSNVSSPEFYANPTTPYTSAPSPYTTPSPYGDNTPYNNSSSPSYMAQGTPSYAGGNFYGSTPGAPAPFPAPARRGLSKGMLTLIISLTALLLLSGGGLIFYSGVYVPTKQHADATGTAVAGTQTQQTSEAQSTATEVAHQTSTAVAQVTGTAQAEATATAQVQATAQAEQNIYTQATKGDPTVNDSLAIQSGLDWDLFDGENGGGCAFNNGALHSTAVSKGYYDPCYAQAVNVTNFALEVDMTIVKGQSGIILFRANKDNASAYFFEVASDGYYYLDVAKNADDSNSLFYKKSSLIHTGEGKSNTLTVIARGSDLYLFINKELATHLTDTTLTTGSIALAGYLSKKATADETDVAFKNLRIWNL